MRTGGNDGRPVTPADSGEKDFSGHHRGGGRGHIFIVGLGPGNREYMCRRARQCLAASDYIVGYKTYLELIKDLVGAGQRAISSGMTGEKERCAKVIALALQGHTVALVSSGDPGVYGMAGIMYQLLEQTGAELPVETVPGITAANAAASSLGAPLMHDFACISLSDLLTPWSVIVKRVEMAARADFVLVFYNPKSKKRVRQIEAVRERLLDILPAERPVGIVRNAKRGKEEVTISSLSDFTSCFLDMFSTVIIGNSQTYVYNGRLITPRGYKL